MDSVDGIVLAAGSGKRMRSATPKVAHALLGRPMIAWSLDALRQAGLRSAVAVVSPLQPIVHRIVQEYAEAHSDFALAQVHQHQPLGTGDAARQGLQGIRSGRMGSALQGRTLLVVTGDTPLLRFSTIQAFVNFHSAGSYAVSVLAFQSPRPDGYGRVLLTKERRFLAIREEKDCSSAEREINLCNSGIMCIDATKAEALFARLTQNNAAGEYYLTDVPAHAADMTTGSQSPVGVFQASDPAEFEGVNNQEQLASAALVLRRRLIAEHMAQGVQFEAPDLAYIEPSVTFGEGVVVEPFVCLKGPLHVESGSRVRSGTGLS